MPRNKDDLTTKTFTRYAVHMPRYNVCPAVHSTYSMVTVIQNGKIVLAPGVEPLTNHHFITVSALLPSLLGEDFVADHFLCYVFCLFSTGSYDIDKEKCQGIYASMVPDRFMIGGGENSCVCLCYYYAYQISIQTPKAKTLLFLNHILN